MTTMADSAQLDLQGEITLIDRAIAETAKYAAGQCELGVKARNFDRNLWQIVVTAMTSGAALFGGGVALVKLLIG